MQIDGNTRTVLFGLKYKWVRPLFWLSFAITLLGICLLGASNWLRLPPSVGGLVSLLGLGIVTVFGIPWEFAHEDELQRRMQTGGK